MIPPPVAPLPEPVPPVELLPPEAPLPDVAPAPLLIAPFPGSSFWLQAASDRPASKARLLAVKSVPRTKRALNALMTEGTLLPFALGDKNSQGHSMSIVVRWRAKPSA